MRLVHPDAALWLLALPAVWALLVLHRRLRDRTRRLSGYGRRLELLSNMTGARYDATVATLAMIVGLSLVVTAIRPQVAIRAPAYESRDLLLLIDRSASMQAQDVRPSRARRASLEIRNFIQARPDTIARIGLIGFAGSSLTLSQPTTDVDTVLFYLDWIDEDRTPLFGTNLRAALENALELVRKSDRTRPTIVVILSDGDDHGPPLEATVAKFTAQRIPIYSIGVGSTDQVPIPMTNDTPGFLLDEDGLPLLTQLSEGTLRALAAATGGRYFRSASGADLREAFERIADRERRVVGWTANQYRDISPWSLACGAIALAALVSIL
jgi:Ca-activated chloride channel family protein